MGTLIVRRLVMMVFVLVGISLITFGLSRVIPTDAARLIAGPRASPASLTIIRHEYGLDLPLPEQYMRYMTGIFRLDFGQSFSSKRPVSQDLHDFLPATAELALFALFFAMIGGVLIGVLAAVYQNSWFDQLSRLVAISGLSLPAFWLALLAQLLLYQRLGWLPFGGRLSDGLIAPPTVTGFLTIDSLLVRDGAVFKDAFLHLLMPAFVLGLEPLAVFTRITRTSMLEVMREQYVLAARAKGLRRRLVIWKHSFRNALIPVATMTGLMIGYLLGGSILVETVFAWPGVGRYSARAILSADYNAIMGVTLIMALIFMLSNFLTDLIYARLDPRIKY